MSLILADTCEADIGDHVKWGTFSRRRWRSEKQVQVYIRHPLYWFQNKWAHQDLDEVEKGECKYMIPELIALKANLKETGLILKKTLI